MACCRELLAPSKGCSPGNFPPRCGTDIVASQSVRRSTTGGVGGGSARCGMAIDPAGRIRSTGGQGASSMESVNPLTVDGNGVNGPSVRLYALEPHTLLSALQAMRSGDF